GSGRLVVALTQIVQIHRAAGKRFHRRMETVDPRYRGFRVMRPTPGREKSGAKAGSPERKSVNLLRPAPHRTVQVVRRGDPDALRSRFDCVDDLRRQALDESAFGKDRSSAQSKRRDNGRVGEILHLMISHRANAVGQGLTK